MSCMKGLYCHFSLQSQTAYLVVDVYISPLSQQQGHHIQMAVSRRQVEPRPASLVLGV